MAQRKAVLVIWQSLKVRRSRAKGRPRPQDECGRMRNIRGAWQQRIGMRKRRPLSPPGDDVGIAESHAKVEERPLNTGAKSSRRGRSSSYSVGSLTALSVPNGRSVHSG
ncbi:hypothetical protein Trco_002565 [Trichoderma cornu-damae]|uniref:Uncharacterized protein n=1 Tax=Trichoderma cornu-damae TaxID=654480 RepID=A0A9P8TZ88_9HYPO|nr:hypothetical protein Trco_002565 [Trichoderma cornu-damae]